MKTLQRLITTEDNFNKAIDFCTYHGVYNIGAQLTHLNNITENYPTELAGKVAKCLVSATEESGSSVASSKYTEAYDIMCKSLERSEFAELSTVNALLYNKNLLVPNIKERYIDYPRNIVDIIMNREINTLVMPMYTLTVTTCKRLDLFVKTMNSFLNCCEDLLLIDRWICVDDNSSESDREIMQSLYPFFEFVFKTPSQKGHPQSMNILLKKIKERKTHFIFHMEDDWMFYEKKCYISTLSAVLEHSVNQGVMQCLVNKNYGETEKCIDIKGGIFCETNNRLRYYIHEWCPTEESMNEFSSKYGKNCKQCAYWPHYSLRPSLIRYQVFELLGDYNETVSHFEMDYAYKYVTKFKSAFLEGMYSYHIGRLTSERNDLTKKNAYSLNDEVQFGDKNVAKQPPTSSAVVPSQQQSQFVPVNLSPEDMKRLSDAMNAAKTPQQQERTFNPTQDDPPANSVYQQNDQNIPQNAVKKSVAIYIYGTTKRYSNYNLIYNTLYKIIKPSFVYKSTSIMKLFEDIQKSTVKTPKGDIQMQVVPDIALFIDADQLSTLNVENTIQGIGALFNNMCPKEVLYYNSRNKASLFAVSNDGMKRILEKYKRDSGEFNLEKSLLENQLSYIEQYSVSQIL